MKFLSYEGLQYLYSKILTRFNLKVDKSNGDISDTKIYSVDTIATSFPIPNAGENTKTFMGKVKKALTDWSDFKTGIVTLGMLTNQHINSTDKIPTAALLYSLKTTVDTLNSNLALKANVSALENTNTVLNNTTNALNYRITSRASIRWDDAGVLQLFIDDIYVGAFKLV